MITKLAVFHPTMLVYEDPNNCLEAYGSVCYVPFRDGNYLFNLQVGTAHQRRGVGTALVEGVLTKGITYLRPNPYGNMSMNKTLLTEWYVKLGFVRIQPDGLMRRDK